MRPQAKFSHVEAQGWSSQGEVLRSIPRSQSTPFTASLRTCKTKTHIRKNAGCIFRRGSHYARTCKSLLVTTHDCFICQIRVHEQLVVGGWWDGHAVRTHSRMIVNTAYADTRVPFFACTTTFLCCKVIRFKRYMKRKKAHWYRSCHSISFF